MKISERTKDNIVELYKQGVAILKIEEQLGTNQYQIDKTLNERGIERRNKKRADYEDKAVEMFERGMSWNEIGRRLGVSETTLSKIRDAHGLNQGTSALSEETVRKIIELYNQGLSIGKISNETGVWKQAIVKHLRNAGYDTSARSYERLSDEEIQRRLGDAWIYVGGYKSFNSKILVKCPICGIVKEVSRKTVSGGLAPCSCVKEEAKQKAEIQKILDFWGELQKPKPLKRDIVIGRCRICGKPFVKDNGKSAYCSEDCARRGRRIKEAKKHDIRLRRMKESEMDDISLEELYQRDAGVCWICGEPCDYADYFWRDNTFFAGDTYPSIDHVVPIAKGGTHKWENVRLAHRICNTLKGIK